MVRRLISATKSEIREMSAMEMKSSIRASEGRVVLAQNFAGHQPLVEGATNIEMSEAMGADMVFLNGYSMNPEDKMPALLVDEYVDGAYKKSYYRLRDVKKWCNGPLGIYLECGSEDDPSASTSFGDQLVRPERIASEENLKKLLDEEADFVVLAGNPGTGTSMEGIIEATARAKKILGDKVMIWAGKWEDGVKEKVLGDPLASYDAKDVIKRLIDAGADCICLPMPGARTGITVEAIRDLVLFAHTYKEDTLVMSFLDGSVEGSDTETIRQCTLLSKQTGADIHAIGDAGLVGMATPENIYQMAMTTKGRRLAWMKIGGGHR